jgi:tetratricopeptide (TPR) repeat protein
MAESGFHVREKILAFSFATLVVFFGLTGVAVRQYHSTQASVAQQWYQRGDSELTAGHATKAVDDFNNALVYSRDNNLFELRLAQAFIAAGRAPEAQAHLEELWERTPGSGIVNLELARVAAQRGDSSEAIRYYNNAIYGVWEGEADQQGKRRDAAYELYQFLISQGQRPQAEAELMAIAAALPANPALHVHLGEVMLSNGEFANARNEFRSALEVDRTQPQALEGAGEASFQLADYPAAVRYLDQATRNKNPNPAVKPMLAVSQAVLELDPFDSRLSGSERAGRASRSFALAVARLDSCTGLNVHDHAAAPPVDIQAIYSQAQKTEALATPSYLQRHPEEIASLMVIVMNMETAAVSKCGEPTAPEDRALLLITRSREAGQP